MREHATARHFDSFNPSRSKQCYHWIMHRQQDLFQFSSTSPGQALQSAALRLDSASILSSVSSLIATDDNLSSKHSVPLYLTEDATPDVLKRLGGFLDRVYRGQGLCVACSQCTDGDGELVRNTRRWSPALHERPEGSFDYIKKSPTAASI